MREANLPLPDTLIIPGQLGIALDKNWKYYLLLLEWYKWENKLKLDRIVASIYPAIPYPPAPPTIEYQQINVLSRALQLPPGWESYVHIDESVSVSDRVNHMRASYAYMKRNPKTRTHRLTEYNSELYRLSKEDTTTVTKTATKKTITTTKAVGSAMSILEPFFRNIWLSDTDRVDIPTYLVFDKMDYAAMKAYIAEYNVDEKVVQLANGMLQGGFIPNYFGIVLGETNGKLGIVTFHPEDTGQALGRLYTRLLRNLPNDVDPEALGLRSILVADDEYDTLGYTTLNRLVGRINTYTLTYLALFGEPVPEREFPRSVRLVGETLGLYALRRMVLSLLHHLKKEGSNKRVEVFIDVAEDYLDRHTGEDEGVVEL